MARYGKLDVMINNAGVSASGRLMDITVDDWDLTFAINARAALLTTQVAAASMIAADLAPIVQTPARKKAAVG